MADNALLADYLFVGPQIIARLANQIPELPVEGIEDLAQVGAEDARPQVAFVLWDGDRFDVGPNGSRLAGSAQLLVQTWTVILYAKHASQLQRDARARHAGAYLSRIHAALAAFKPEGAVHALKRANGRAPHFTKLSGMFPLSFEIQLAL